MATNNTFMNFAKRVPALNEEARKRLEAGRAIQMQQAAQQAPAGMPATRAAQALAPAVTAQAGEQMLQQQAQSQQQMAGLAQAGMQQQAQQQEAALQKQALTQQEALQQKGLSQQADLAREEMAMKNALTDEEIASAQRVSQYGLDVDTELSSMSRKMREDLAQLGGDVKQKLFDAQLVFDRNELGRKFDNHRQMLRATVANAKSDQELKQKLTIMQQEAAKEMILLESAHNQMLKALERGYLDEKRELDQDQKMRLAVLTEKIRKKLERKKRDAKNQGLLMGGLTMAAGAGLMFVPGAQPVGATVLASGAGMAGRNE